MEINKCIKCGNETPKLESIVIGVVPTYYFIDCCEKSRSISNSSEEAIKDWNEKNPKQFIPFRFKKSFYVKLEDEEIQQAKEAVNEFYFNDKRANKIDEMTGELVGKYDNHPDFKKVKDAHYRIHRGQMFEIEFKLDQQGNLTVEKYGHLKTKEEWNE